MEKFQKHGISYGTKNKWMEFRIRKEGTICGSMRSNESYFYVLAMVGKT
jgi:hypothetical protein